MADNSRTTSDDENVKQQPKLSADAAGGVKGGKKAAAQQ